MKSNRDRQTEKKTIQLKRNGKIKEPFDAFDFIPCSMLYNVQFSMLNVQCTCRSVRFGKDTCTPQIDNIINKMYPKNERSEDRKKIHRIL